MQKPPPLTGTMEKPVFSLHAAPTRTISFSYISRSSFSVLDVFIICRLTSLPPPPLDTWLIEIMMAGFSGKVVEGEMRDRVDGFGISMKSHMVATFRGWARSMQDLAAWMLRWSWAGANAFRTVLGLKLRKEGSGLAYIYIHILKPLQHHSGPGV